MLQRAYGYDAAGNLIEERRGKGGQQRTTLSYDHQNQLREVTRAGKTTRFEYDALGRRTRKSTRTETGTDATEFVWNGDQLLSEYRTDHQPLHYLHAPGSFVPLAQLRGEEVYHYVVDQIGTPQALVDERGEVVWEPRYRLHGAVASLDVSRVDNRIRFQGQYFDVETGLHYNRFRYYHPGTGRFVNQDPVGLAGGEHSYRYAPNTTAWVDPLGLICKELRNTDEIRFTQDTTGTKFGDGRPVVRLIEDLKSESYHLKT